MVDTQQLGRPTAAFVGASWVALGLGVVLFFVGLWNAQMALSEKGYFLAVFMLGLFAAISVQKAVRDRAENVPVTGIYLGVAWSMLLASLVLLSVGLWNAQMLLSEKGFYGIGFAMSLFAVVMSAVIGLDRVEPSLDQRRNQLVTLERAGVSQ